jgi:SAM-dependent methyltransferase
MDNGTYYDSDYYEDGIASGKSCYENYRWIPELTIPMAMSLIDKLVIERYHTVLDFGCAKGYLVKAFRLLYRQAWGVDVSKYAIESVDPNVKDICFLSAPDFSLCHAKNMPKYFDFCIAKDVFEHVPLDMLKEVIRNIPAQTLFVVVPLGDGEKYNIPCYHLDKTHIHIQPLDWWEGLFHTNGWSVIESEYRVKGIKDKWNKYQKGNGFFTLRNRGIFYSGEEVISCSAKVG